MQWFLNSLSESDFAYLAKCVLTDDRLRVDNVIKQVFGMCARDCSAMFMWLLAMVDAMDTNGDGFVDTSEIKEWIKNEVCTGEYECCNCLLVLGRLCSRSAMTSIRSVSTPNRRSFSARLTRTQVSQCRMFI